MTEDTKVAALDDLEEAMRDVVDPELGINVVDLGLVYGITVDESRHAVIDMTLTSAACPLTDVIEDQVDQALSDIVSARLTSDGNCTNPSTRRLARGNWCSRSV